LKNKRCIYRIKVTGGFIDAQINPVNISLQEPPVPAYEEKKTIYRVPVTGQKNSPRSLDLVIDTHFFEVYKNGKPLKLTSSEYRIFYKLYVNQGCYISAGELYCFAVDDHAAVGGEVKWHIMNLRRKLGDSARNPKYIECRRGFGYRLRAGVCREF